jgi:hypothetical protein
LNYYTNPVFIGENINQYAPFYRLCLRHLYLSDAAPYFPHPARYKAPGPGTFSKPHARHIGNATTLQIFLFLVMHLAAGSITFVDINLFNGV